MSMMHDPRDLRASILRQHLYCFVWKVFTTLHPGQRFIPAWHIEAMCQQLQRVYDAENRRLLITVPPRHGKSICTAVAFVAWAMGHDPSLRFLVASYGQDLANKHARDYRTVIEAPWYRSLFPAMQINPRRNTAAEIVTTSNGFRKSLSIGGPVTGFGGDILIVDDLMKADDARSETERARVKDFYEQTLYSRLDDKQTGAIIALQQRLHEDDFAAYLIDKGNFEHLNLQAIAEQNETFDLTKGRCHVRHKGEPLFPEKEPLETLKEMRRDIGSYAFSAQYQQNPVPPGGNRINLNWFGTYKERPPREYFQLVVQSWDTAMTAEPTSDFSVCMTWGFRERKWYLLDLFRDRLDYPDLKRRVISLRDRWNPGKVIVERAGTGIPLLHEFRNEGRGLLLGYQPLVDKVTRLEAQTAKLETGNFLLPEDAEWLEAFRHELRAFPNGRYDDQVDSMSQFLEWSGTRRGMSWQECELNGGRSPGRQRSR
jgi:predicted phage terminase large subunit-like protein